VLPVPVFGSAAMSQGEQLSLSEVPARAAGFGPPVPGNQEKKKRSKRAPNRRLAPVTRFPSRPYAR